MDKLVDEYLKGVVTHKQSKQTVWAIEQSVWPAWPTIVMHKVKNLRSEQKDLESSAKDGESPVCQVSQTLLFVLSSRTGHVKSCLNLGRPRPKAKYILRSIVNKYREGKVKRTPEGEWNRSWNRVHTNSRSGLDPWLRTFCIMGQRLTFSGKVNRVGKP